MHFSQDSYQRALSFAATAHGAQQVPGSQHPYVVHLANVAMEVLVAAADDPFDANLAVTCALLHDTLEDTQTTEEAVAACFGPIVARGVRALTKNASLPKSEQMRDSLARIVKEPREVAIVKLADRITNLQEPPAYWKQEKRAAYREEARAILAALGHACVPLARRLADKIEAYAAFLS